MAHIHRRWDGPDQWYFVTVVTKRREPIFSDPNWCQALKQSFHEVRAHHVFRLGGLVILEDHWHAMIQPSPPTVIETIVGAIKHNMLNKIWEIQNRSSIWQPQFLDHRIRDEDDFLFHLEYIQTNAIKHGYVARIDEYKWCFIHKDPFGFKR